MDAHLLNRLVWGIGSDVETFLKHGDYWLVYENDGPLPASPLQTRPKPSMAPELQIEAYLSPNDNREEVFLRLG